VFLETLALPLAALHSIEHHAAAAAGWPPAQPVQVRETWAEQMDRSRPVLEMPDSVWGRWQTWLADDTYWPKHSVLIHSDLHPAHMLVDTEHRVTGLLDWTEARGSDPATEFTVLFATLGHGPLGMLLHRYREAGGRLWSRMHEQIVESWSALPGRHRHVRAPDRRGRPPPVGPDAGRSQCKGDGRPVIAPGDGLPKQELQRTGLSPRR
jgi:macrolide phosphotransferase